MTITATCVQCKRPIVHADQLTDIWREGLIVPLHRGGCLRPLGVRVGVS